MDALTDLTLHEAAAHLRAGEVSSRELTEACLERVAAVDPRLNAFLAVTPELARASADAADVRLAAWRREPSVPLHPLAGLPLAIKECYACAGRPPQPGHASWRAFGHPTPPPLSSACWMPA